MLLIRNEISCGKLRKSADGLSLLTPVESGIRDEVAEVHKLENAKSGDYIVIFQPCKFRQTGVCLRNAKDLLINNMINWWGE